MVTDDDIPEAGLEILRESCDLIILQNYSRAEILDKSKGVDGIFWATHEKLNAEVLDAAGAQLKSISTMSVGVDHVDVAEVKRRKIPLGYTPNVLNDAVADVGIGLAIAASRRYCCFKTVSRGSNKN